MDFKKKKYSRRDILFGFKNKFKKQDSAGTSTGIGFQAKEIDELMASGRFEQAGQELQKVLEKSPDHQQARKNLGYCLLKTSRLDEAAAQFRSVLRSRADDNFCLLHLGLILVKQGRTAEAISWWREYFNPDQPVINRVLNLQISLYDMGTLGSGEEIEKSVEAAIKEQRAKDGV
ncbi:MAG: tetratricopeptide repeat protein [Desulfohalobiaceae bacterium]|nr:tetratricopeptide repeat protein [Desulfohalobiaceae bacterium]